MKRVAVLVLTGMSSLFLGAAANNGDAISAALAGRHWVCGDYNLSKSVYEYYYNEIVRKDVEADALWLSLKTPAEIEKHQKKLREEMVKAIGGFPERCPLNVRVVETVKRDGYSVEKIVFESRPRFYVTAHRFVPDSAKFKPPYPAAIVPCGHSRSGKLAPWYQRPGVIGAKLGFMTLVYDPIDQGERSQMRPFTNLTWSTTAEHNRGGVRMMLLGWNLAQFRIYDGMRAIDVLSEDGRVDASKIGVLGISGGGTLTSFIMALDERVRAACPAGYLTTMRTLCDHCGVQDAEQNIFGQLNFSLNHLGYVLMRAPSPVLLNATHSDAFPMGGSIETAIAAKKVFGMLDAADKFDIFDVQGPHHWFESQQQASFVWMKDQFGLSDNQFAPNAESFKKLDVGFSYGAVDVGFADIKRSQRYITDSGKVTERGYVLDLPQARSIYDIMRGEQIRTAVLKGTLTRDDVREKAGFRKRGELSWQIADKVESSQNGIAISKATILLPGMLRIPIVTFTPESAKARPVLVVSDCDRVELSGKVRAFLGEGRKVMVAELRAFGETGHNRRENARGFYGCKDADEEIAMMCYWLGNSLVGHRSEDLICAAMALSAENGGKPVDLYCEGRAVIPAAHAFYCENDLFASFISEREPASWESVVTDAECFHYRFANAVHGALRLYDWTDLVKSGSK